MVVLDALQIDDVETKYGIKNKILLDRSLASSKKIDDVLHVITYISNVCEFKRRWQLMNEFIDRMSKIKNIQLYVVELAYGDQDFHITSSDNPNHLQLRTEYALWHKENMINLAIKKLLPAEWKAVAWIDGDIEFENNDWVDNALKVLVANV